MPVTITDQRVLEACKGLKLDVNKLSPQQRFEAYCEWTLPTVTDFKGWGKILLDVAYNCGITKL